MDLIDEKESAAPVGRFDGGDPDGFPDVGNGSLHAAEFQEAALGMAGDQARKACLSGAGWTVEDDRGEAVGLDGPPEKLALAEEMLLTDIFLEACGPHPCGKRGISRQSAAFGCSRSMAKKILHVLTISRCISLARQPPPFHAWAHENDPSRS